MRSGEELVEQPHQLRALNRCQLGRHRGPRSDTFRQIGADCRATRGEPEELDTTVGAGHPLDHAELLEPVGQTGHVRRIAIQMSCQAAHSG